MYRARKSSLFGKITVFFVIFCFCLSADAKYGGGSGTAIDPYLIYTAEQMNAIGADSNDWDKHFLLCADIDLSTFTGTSFNIIGNQDYPFRGVFDGNGHTISNFTYTSTDTGNIGLFRYIYDPNAEIKNLGLIEPSVDAGTGYHVGSLVGWLESGTITNCYVEAGGVQGRHSVGGLVGYNGGTITNCYATGSVFGEQTAGGLVGYNENSIVDCYTSGNVTGGDDSYYVGGLCGKSVGPHHGTGQSRIQNCFSKANVTGNSLVGGLIGHNGRIVTNCYSTGSVIGGDGSWGIGGLIGRNGGNGIIKNCYSTGSVVADAAGGLVGSNSGSVFASYWDIETSGQTTSDGGADLTTAQMQMAITFICWGYEPVWTIDEGVDYPRLLWENKPGELITVPSHLYGGGTGAPEDPFLIYTAEHLNTIGLYTCHLDKHFKLMEDIDLREFTGTSFNIIGIDRRSPFSGVFDGNGHTISNFTYTSTDKNNIGLFRYVTGLIRNLGLIDPNVDAGTGTCVGSLVGYMGDGKITNCYAEGGSASGNKLVGGLVGHNSGYVYDSYSTASVSGVNYVGGLLGNNYGYVYDSYSTASVSGDEYVGGLVGYNNQGKITNSYSTGSASGTNIVGGMVGKNEKGTITKCYSSDSVLGDSKVGGLVGDNRGRAKGKITNCYSKGSVSGDRLVGGLVGYNEATITNCYSIGSVSGNWNVGGLVGRSYRGVPASFWNVETSGQTASSGGTGLTTAEMQMMSTFTDAGWDFVGETINGREDIWFIPQGDYPRLWWEGMGVPMKLTPRKLNCRSEGNWVKAHLTLPEGFTVEDVVPGKLSLLHSSGFQSEPLYVFVNKDNLVEIEAAFMREAICSLAGDWPDELTVAGFLTDDNIFLGTSTIKIIHPGMKVIEDLAWYWLNENCDHPDFCDGTDMNRDSLVNLPDYALLLNSQVEFATDE